MLTINGRKLFVQDAAVADRLLVAARTRTAANPERGITLLVVPADAPGIQLNPLKTLASDQQSEVVFTNVRVPASAALGDLGEAWAVVQRTLQRAAAVKACEMLGSAQRILEMTVEYVKNRLQFGRPIGSFQAIQQHCANMAVDVEGARYVAYRAAWKLAQGEDAAAEVAMSKAWVSDAVRRVGEVAHQCHGPSASPRSTTCSSSRAAQGSASSSTATRTSTGRLWPHPWASRQASARPAPTTLSFRESGNPGWGLQAGGSPSPSLPRPP